MKKVIVILLLLISMNAGAQWVPYSMPYNGFAYTLGFYDLNKGMSFGHTMFPAYEKMYYTTNSGSNWILSVYPLQLRAISNVQYINASIIYACGAENVGFSNKNIPVNDFISFPKNIRDRFIREGKREFYTEYKSAFIKSTDGGLNWQRGCQFDTLTGYVMDIHFFDANTGYALIDSNSFGNTKFYKTINAGANWQLISRIDTSAEVESLVFFDMNTGFAKGFNAGGRIYKTTNAGLNWTVKAMPTQIDGITFYNSSTGIAVGITESGATATVYRTTDAGNQWNVVYTNPGRQFQNVMTLQGSGTAFAVGNLIDTTAFIYTKITTLKTTDYGLNWTSKEFNPEILMYGLSIVDASNYFISGGEINVPAMVLKSTNGGNVFVQQTGSEVPAVFELGQNYPNPFNPLTVIRCQLSVSGNLTLKVYDVQGREVQTLINERVNAGTYEVTFDGSGLTSGVYFYKLSTEGYSETKKMVLLK